MCSDFRIYFIILNTHQDILFINDIQIQIREDFDRKKATIQVHG